MNTQDTAVNVERKKKKQIKWWYPGKKQNHYDYKWISVYPKKWNKPEGISFKWSPAGYFDNRMEIIFCLGWIQVFIHLPIYSTITDECDAPEYGFYYYQNESLVLCLGQKRKFIYMPWSLDWVRTSKLKADKTWYTERKGDVKKRKKLFPNETISERWKWEKEQKGELWKETHHYKYTTKYGEVQDDIEATIGVSEMEWRPRAFRWTKLFGKVRRSIDIEFNNEVGSERGSWKGGVIGCSYTMLPGEEPKDTLFRMQKERNFDR